VSAGSGNWVGRWARSPAHLTARTRLTLWYVALLAGTLIVLGGVGQWLTRESLYQGQDEVLRSKAAAVGTEVDMEKGRIEFPDDGPRNVMPSVASGLAVLRVWDKDREVIFNEVPGAGFPDIEPSALTTVLGRVDQFETVAYGGDTFRLYRQPIERKGQVVGVLEIGRSEEEIHAVLGQLRTLSLLGLAVALVVAWLGGSFLAGRALRPVDRITRAAERLGADDLSLRLPVAAVDDEFGRQTAAFNAMLARLEQSFERQRRFTADASHEIRTPLSVIRSLAEVALTSPRDPAYDRRVYASIAEETERLSRLVESLLALARADDGASLTLGPVDLDEVAVDAVERVAERASRQGVQLAVSADERCRVRGDASWLTQLALNLLDNALRHTPGGGRVSIAVATAQDGATLTVSDTGSGIAPEHLPHLFERFYRADDARSRESGGAGLGLAICAWVARAHGGRLDVTSEPGLGTTFSLWLPAAPAAAMTATAPPANSTQSEPLVAPTRRAT
jgi:heavy metal sensor kinase